MTEDEIEQEFINSAIRADEEEERRDREGLSLAGYMRWKSIKLRFGVISSGNTWSVNDEHAPHYRDKSAPYPPLKGTSYRKDLIRDLRSEYKDCLHEKNADLNEVVLRLYQVLQNLGAVPLQEPPSKVATPPSSDTVYKMKTNWPLEDLKALFAAMVEQGWIAEGADALVRKRFTNSMLNEVVEETALFNWLGGIVRLRELLNQLQIPATEALPHFQNKGKVIGKTSLKSGTKETDRPKSESVKELLAKFH